MGPLNRISPANTGQARRRPWGALHYNRPEQESHDKGTLTPHLSTWRTRSDHPGVETAYHYLGPLDTNAADKSPEAIPLLCEDPALWDDGGWVVNADTGSHWITHEELKELIAIARENR